jgi:hypothetical protein
MAARKYNCRARSEKWMEAYQERAMARGDMRRASRAAEMRMLLDNWLNNNAPFALARYSDYD